LKTHRVEGKEKHRRLVRGKSSLSLLKEKKNGKKFCNTLWGKKKGTVKKGSLRVTTRKKPETRIRGETVSPRKRKNYPKR